MLKVACIPAFNEENTIGSVVKKSLEYVDKVIVCNDGSRDKTAKNAEKSGAIVISHVKNLGKGAAMQTLFQQTKDIQADVMVTIDGDGQFSPEEIPKLIDPIIYDKYDVVIGQRFSSEQMPYYRRVGNKALEKILAS